MEMIDQIRLWSTGSIIAAAAVFMLCERLYPYSEQKLLRDGFGTDLVMYALVQSFLLGMLISYIIGVVDDHTAINRISIVRTKHMWVQFLIFFVAHDLYIYWFHRWQHSNQWLWRIHEAHHSTRDVDWLSGSRSHSIEILINQTIEFLPIVLLASPEIAVAKGTVDAVWGMYIHSNINVRSGWLQYIFNGPEMHRWHHALDDDALNKNFSTKLAIWDWLFGTAYRPAHEKPRAYGLGINYPSTYLQQHAHAFRRTSQRHRS